MALRDDEDSLAGAAVVALAVAVAAAKKIKDDAPLARWVQEIETLPAWRDSPATWRQAFLRLRAPHRLPTDSELKRRTMAQTFFNRVCFVVGDATQPGLEMQARHRQLMQAGMFAGVLFSLSDSTEKIDAAIKAAVAERAAHANSKRRKVEAMRAVRTKFDTWQKARGQHPEWKTYKDFGRWAEETHGLDAATVARKAGRWAKEAH
jgi:hypothetical protein